MIFNPVVNGGGGEAQEWKALPNGVSTRAPSRGSRSFSVTFESVPDGIVIKSVSGGLLYSACCGYLFGLDMPSMKALGAGDLYISNESLSENTFSGTITWSDTVSSDFYYKEIRQEAIIMHKYHKIPMGGAQSSVSAPCTKRGVSMIFGPNGVTGGEAAKSRPEVITGLGQLVAGLPLISRPRPLLSWRALSLPRGREMGSFGLDSLETQTLRID